MARLFNRRMDDMLMWVTLSDEGKGLQFTIAAGPRQHSHSYALVQQDSLPYFTGSNLRVLKTRGSGSCIYIPKDQGGQIILKDMGGGSDLYWPSNIRCISFHTKYQFSKSTH
jgi:hypothetical protein